MPVSQATVLHIVCDNPSCPGNDLDPKDRTGWTFVTAEVYGDPSDSGVFCSAECLSASAAAAEPPARLEKVPVEAAPTV